MIPHRIILFLNTPAAGFAVCGAMLFLCGFFMGAAYEMNWSAV